MPKQLIDIICSFILGASVSSLITIKIMETECERRIDEEIEKTRDFYEKHIELLKKCEEKGFTINIPREKVDPEALKILEDQLDESFKEVKEYNDLIDSYITDDPDKEKTVIDIFDEEDEQEDLNNAIGDGSLIDVVEIDGEAYEITNEEKDICENPYIITEEEFSTEKLHYDKISAVYYTDGTLADEDEEMLDIDSTVGYDALDELVNNKTVYVRNERLGIDYMLTSTTNSYADYILGGEYEDEEDNRRRKGNDEG